MKSRMKDTLLLISSNIADRMELRPIFQENYYLLEAETAEQGIFLLEQNRPCIAAVIACISACAVASPSVSTKL